MIGTWSRRLLTLAVLALVALIAPGTAAHAHSSEIGSSPRAGEVLPAAPASVEVEFDSPLLDIGAAIVVRSQDGVSVATGSPVVGRRTISLAVDPAAGPGEYTVAYRVVSQDGHAIESTFVYSVTGEPSRAPRPPSASASPDPSTSDLTPVAAAVEEPTTGADEPPYGVILAVALVGVSLIVGAIALRR